MRALVRFLQPDMSWGMWEEATSLEKILSLDLPRGKSVGRFLD